MEAITIRPKDAKSFDDLVHNSLPDDGHLIIATKEGATQEGNPAVVISFGVQVGQKTYRAQTVTTLRLLTVAMNGIRAAHIDQ